LPHYNAGKPKRGPILAARHPTAAAPSPGGEARDRTGRYFRLEDCLDTLRHPDLQAAVDGLFDRLLAHAGRKLDDDVALLLLEATSTPARSGQDAPAVRAPGPGAVPRRKPLAAAGAS